MTGIARPLPMLLAKDAQDGDQERLIALGVGFIPEHVRLIREHPGLI